MADRRHHGESEHRQRHVMMPTMPRPALIVIEPEFVFRGLKAVLDRPAMAFDRHTLQNPLRQTLELSDVAVQPFGDIYREGQPVLPVDHSWLSLLLKERPAGITGSCSYKPDLFKRGTVSQWTKDFVSILDKAVANPEIPIAHLLDGRAASVVLDPLD
jgi:hypothetical protein